MQMFTLLDTQSTVSYFTMIATPNQTTTSAAIRSTAPSHKIAGTATTITPTAQTVNEMYLAAVSGGVALLLLVILIVCSTLIVILIVMKRKLHKQDTDSQTIKSKHYKKHEVNVHVHVYNCLSTPRL